MGCRGVFFALLDDDSKNLLAAGSDDKVLEYVTETIEERWDQGWLCETDVAWNVFIF